MNLPALLEKAGVPPERLPALHRAGGLALLAHLQRRHTERSHTQRSQRGVAASARTADNPADDPADNPADGLAGGGATNPVAERLRAAGVTKMGERMRLVNALAQAVSTGKAPTLIEQDMRTAYLIPLPGDAARKANASRGWSGYMKQPSQTDYCEQEGSRCH